MLIDSVGGWSTPYILMTKHSTTHDLTTLHDQVLGARLYVLDFMFFNLIVFVYSLGLESFVYSFLYSLETLANCLKKIIYTYIKSFLVHFKKCIGSNGPNWVLVEPILIEILTSYWS